MQDDRIRFRSDAYALESGSGLVLVDPLPLSDAALASLGRVAAICLTEGQHQRSAWRYRKRFGVAVHAPEGSHALEEPPDVWYTDGSTLPGGLRSLSTPGFGTVHCALVSAGSALGTVLFCGDLVMRANEGAFSLVPDEHVEDPAAIRASVARLVDLVPNAVCPAHGLPAVSGGGEALSDALRHDL